MKVVAKSILKEKHIKDKISKGADALEIQLSDEIYEGVIEYESLKLLDVYSVHMPLGAHRYDTNIEDVDTDIFDIGCFIAEKAAKIWNHEVILVLHFELDYDKVIRSAYITDHLLKMFKEAIEKYPNISFGLENIIPIVPKENSWYLANNFYDDSVKLVKYLKRKISEDKFSTVLDTCHAAMSIYYMNKVMSLTNQDYVSHTMEDFFKLNKGLCKTIHLCTFNDDGYFKNHGIGFSGKESELNEYLKLWNEYTKNAALVLELREFDYTNSINFYENQLLLKSSNLPF